jgi:uncharacterized low-complexity protein
LIIINQLKQKIMKTTNKIMLAGSAFLLMLTLTFAFTQKSEKNYADNQYAQELTESQADFSMKCNDAKAEEKKCGDSMSKDKKCGEGKCGDAKTKDAKADKKCGEGKCGDAKAKDKKCGEGKCGDAKAKDKKSDEKCGEGKCGK